jgi:hypothetical protein
VYIVSTLPFFLHYLLGVPLETLIPLMLVTDIVFLGPALQIYHFIWWHVSWPDAVVYFLGVGLQCLVYAVLGAAWLKRNPRASWLWLLGIAVVVSLMVQWRAVLYQLSKWAP